MRVRTLVCMSLLVCAFASAHAAHVHAWECLRAGHVHMHVITSALQVHIFACARVKVIVCAMRACINTGMVFFSPISVQIFECFRCTCVCECRCMCFQCSGITDLCVGASPTDCLGSLPRTVTCQAVNSFFWGTKRCRISALSLSHSHGARPHRPHARCVPTLTTIMARLL